MKFMNYSKIINNTAFAALLATGAFAGFMIGVKLPSAFASLYSVPPSSIAAVELAVAEIKLEIKPEVKEIKPEVKPTIKSEIKSAVKTPITAGPKIETLQLINPPAPIKKDIGKPDLAVKILEIGVIDKITNVWTATTSLRSIDRIAVRFLVENLGTKETDSWYFNAVLPTYPSYIYSSPSQISLKAGERIEFTLGFDSVEKKDGNIVVINIDPNNSVSEASEENNIARVTIDGVSF